MYKLHYDVDPGEQINVVYKGMDIEVQAGEGSGDVTIENNKEVTLTEFGSHEITPSDGKDAMAKVTIDAWPENFLGDAIYSSTCDNIVIDANRKGTYTFYNIANVDLVYRDGASFWETGELIIQPFNDFLLVFVNVPVLPYSVPFEYMLLPYVYFKGGDQSEHPIKQCVVTGLAEIQEDLTIGTASSTHARYAIFGGLVLSADLTLNGCDVYLYTDELEDYGNHIYDGTNGGIVHVLTTYSGSTFGGHAVIKDLTPPDETN